MSKPKLLITSSVVVFLAFIAAGGWVWYGERGRGTPRLNTPKEPIISVSQQGNERVVRNTVDKFQVTVPKVWVVSPGVDQDIRLRADKTGPGQPDIPTEVVDGAIFEITNDPNIEHLELEQWLLKNGILNATPLLINNQYQAYQKVTKIIDDSNFIGDVPPDVQKQYMIADSEAIFIYFQKSNRDILELACTAVGPSYKQYADECLSVAQSFVLYDK